MNCLLNTLPGEVTMPDFEMNVNFVSHWLDAKTCNSHNSQTNSVSDNTKNLNNRTTALFATKKGENNTQQKPLYSEMSHMQPSITCGQ